MSVVSSWLDSDYAFLSDIAQKGDSFSLTIMELQILVGLRGLDESCGARLKLKIPRKTGEMVSREMCVCNVCVCVGVCVYAVCVYAVCVCMCVKCLFSAGDRPWKQQHPSSSEHTWG